MDADVFVDTAGDGVDPVPLDEITDLLAKALGIPVSDAEVRDLAGLLHAALESARTTDRIELLDDALRFARGRFAVRGLTEVSTREVGAALERAVRPSLTTGERDHVRELLERCSADPVSSPAAEEVELGPLCAAYVEHLVRGDRKGAVALTRRCVAEGMDIYEILLDILEPALHEVGRRWALGHITVAQEHFCTAVTQFVMTDLYPGLFTGEESPRRLVAVNVPGSTHHVGLRMVTDVLECRAWSTTYLVDDVTLGSLPDLVAEDQADLLLISASMPGQIGLVGAMIRAVRQDPRTRDVKIVVGGRPFRLAPDLVSVVGADGWARDARMAVEVCDRLVPASAGGGRA